MLDMTIFFPVEYTFMACFFTMICVIALWGLAHFRRAQVLGSLSWWGFMLPLVLSLGFLAYCLFIVFMLHFPSITRELRSGFWMVLIRLAAVFVLGCASVPIFDRAAPRKLRKWTWILLPMVSIIFYLVPPIPDCKCEADDVFYEQLIAGVLPFGGGEMVGLAAYLQIGQALWQWIIGALVLFCWRKTTSD